MGDYDCCDPRSITSPSLETTVSSSQALPSSTSESMWEGWSQASPVSQCTLSEQLQQQLGGGYSSIANAKSGSSYQHDLLSSWLMSGYQTVSLSQQLQHGIDEGSGIITMYPDEFSRMNICSSTVSSDSHVVATPPVVAATGGGSDRSHQFYDVIQTSGSKSELPNEVGESSQFLASSPSPDHHKFLEAPEHKIDVSLDMNANRKIVHQMNATLELSSRASSSSPPSGLNSYGQTMQQQQQQQHLGHGQFDSSTYWASSGSTPAVTSSSPQPSDCGGGGDMRTSGQQRKEQQPNTSCDSIILHHQQRRSTKNRCEGEGDDTFFHQSGTDLSADQMYTELHGLFSKSLETPKQRGAVDNHHQQQLAICSNEAKSDPAGSYGDHSSWSQFTVNPNFLGPSSHGGGFMGIQEVDKTTFNSTTTPDSLSTVSRATTRRDELSPSSAGTAMSTVHNFRAGAAVTSDRSHAPLPYRPSSSADLDCSDLGLQRKRPLSRGNEQVGENGVSAADDSVKRSRIVRCLWEQNIAQLQLANLPSEHQRNLWQLQSQALFGRLPGDSFLNGGSSSNNSGSIDMTTAVGPALNTNGRPRARRGSATDPQSVYARHRRERINDRLKVLQHLVPNGAKVDIVTMLEEAISYVKFLQLQVRLLSSDELWIYAPTTYNGVDVSMGMHTGLLNQQA